MEQRYLRQYRLTLGLPLSFYQDAVKQEAYSDPRERQQRELFFRRDEILSGRRNPSADAIINQKDRTRFETFYQNQQLLANKFEEGDFNGVVIEGLNFSFDLAKGGDESTNRIKLYNITDKTRSFLNQYGKALPIVQLEAGYSTDKTLPIVYKGEVIGVNDVWEGSTRVTTLTVKAGASAIKEAYTIRSFKKGTTLETIVREVIGDMKLDYGTIFIPRIDERAIAIDKNYYLQCKSVDGLKRLCTENDLDMVIEDGKVNVLPKNVNPLPENAADLNSVYVKSLGYSVEELAELTQQAKFRRIVSGRTLIPSEAKFYQINRETAKVFSPSLNNLIGSPSIDTNGADSMERQVGKADNITIKTFLDGTLKIGDVVQVTSYLIDGFYEIQTIRHFGEFEGSDWYTELTLKMNSSWVVDEGVEITNKKLLEDFKKQYGNK